jgi:hypothetical protein
VKDGFPGAGDAGAAGGIPVSLGLGVGEADDAAAGAAAAPLGRQVGMGKPDGSGIGREGRHIGIPLGKQVGMPEGMGTGSDGMQVGTPPLGKHVGNPEGSGTGSEGRHVGMPPLDRPVEGGGVVCEPPALGGAVDWPGTGRLGGSGWTGAGGVEFEAAKVRPTGRARTTPRVRTSASRTDRVLIAGTPPASPASPFPCDNSQQMSHARYPG